MRGTITFLVLTSLAFAQQPKAPQPKSGKAKPVRHEISGFAVAPVVLPDEGCARDYIRMFEAEGVERRKRMSDLLTYRCLDTSAKGIFSAISMDRKDFAIVKDEEAFFVRVALLFDKERTQRAIGGSEVYNIAPPNASYFGWIPERDFYAVTGAQFDEMVATGKITVRISR